MFWGFPHKRFPYEYKFRVWVKNFPKEEKILYLISLLCSESQVAGCKLSQKGYKQVRLFER